MLDTTHEGPVIMDLGDIVPEEYEIRFAIAGHQYVANFGEANVDEVLRLLNAPGNEGEDGIERTRSVVTSFLKKVLTVGDPGQLEADLKKVPYKSQRGALDLKTLFDRIQGRVKKNSPGETATK